MRRLLHIVHGPIGWVVLDPHGRRMSDLLRSKEEAILRAKQLTMGDAKSTIRVLRDDGLVDREFQLGRPSVLPPPRSSRPSRISRTSSPSRLSLSGR
jgi:hypothetical protein